MKRNCGLFHGIMLELVWKNDNEAVLLRTDLNLQ
jgi:hypothetical protein